MENDIVDYLVQLQSVLIQLSPAAIQQVVDVLHRARLNGRSVFLVGNGGSAATASHWANDLCKLTLHESLPRLRAIALTDNVPLITAWANDSAYERIFVEQLANLLQPTDIVIGISGSGNSANVLSAMTFARAHRAVTIGLTGFAGGQLKDSTDLCLVVPSDSMQQIEDVHLVLTHIISSSLAGMAKRSPSGEGARAAEIMQEKPSRAVFIDRDGVINENRADYVKTWEEFHFQEGALESIAQLATTDFKVVIVSNQSAIGRSLVSREVVEDIHRRMVDEINHVGGRVDLILYCPHRPDENCHCRKPQPGLLVQASQRLVLNLTSSYLIGDSIEDIRAGEAVGCRCILVRTGRGSEAIKQLGERDGSGPLVADTLFDAVEWILKREHMLRHGGLLTLEGSRLMMETQNAEEVSA